VCRFITIMVLRLLRRCECVVATPSQREKGGGVLSGLLCFCGQMVRFWADSSSV